MYPSKAHGAYVDTAEGYEEHGCNEQWREHALTRLLDRGQWAAKERSNNHGKGHGEGLDILFRESHIGINILLATT